MTAFGAGLSHGAVNRPATFTIVTKDAGEGIGSRKQFFYVSVNRKLNVKQVNVVMVRPLPLCRRFVPGC